MTEVNKFIDKLTEWLVPAWGLLWIILITAVSAGGVIWAVKWILKLLGVL